MTKSVVRNFFPTATEIQNPENLFSFSIRLIPMQYQCDTAFNPIIEAISVAMKKRRQKLAGSLKTSIPIIAVPTAPIPVQTA